MASTCTLMLNDCIPSSSSARQITVIRNLLIPWDEVSLASGNGA